MNEKTPNIKWILQKAKTRPFAYLMDYDFLQNRLTITYLDQTARKFGSKTEASYFASRVFEETNMAWEPRAIAEDNNNAEKTF